MAKIEIRDKNGNRTIIVNGNIGQVIDRVEKNQTVIFDGDCIDVSQCNSVRIEVHGNVGNIKTMSGDVHVDGSVDGTVNTMSGDVFCKQIGGSVRTMSGDIFNNKYNMTFEK